MSKPAPQKTNRVLDHARRLMAEGVHLQQQGEFAEAERRYRAVLADDPKHVDALHFLGLLKHQKDGSAEGLDLMKSSLENGPPNAGYLVNFGKVLQAHGRFEESIQYFRKALAISPSFSEACNRLGESYELLNMPFKACDAYRKAYEIDPLPGENAMNFARALRNTGEFAAAVDVCEGALRTRSEEWQFLYLEVLCLLDLNRVEEALEKMRAALRADPLSAQLHYSMGMVMAESGRFDEAREHYGKALTIDPQYYAVYYSLSAISTNVPGESGAATLEQRLVQAPPRTPEAAVSAEFSLGRMFEDQGQYASAFTHFDLGNKIMRRLQPYSTTEQSEYIDGLLEHLDEGFMSRSGKIGLETETPVFIVGMIRSGTSLVEQILAGHPELAGGGELPFLPQSLSKYAGTLAATGDKIAALSDESLRAMGEHYLAKISALYPGARRITDKLPGNFMLLGLIHALFPKAHIIHCRRDALDTCVSCYLTHFDAGHHYAYDQAELGAYYLLYRRMLDYYQGVIGPSMLTVDYEDLVADLAGYAPKIVEFCGLPWNPACLEFDKTPRMVKTASMYQVRQAVNSRSIGRWRRYADYVGPLRAALGSLAGPE